MKIHSPYFFAFPLLISIIGISICSCSINETSRSLSSSDEYKVANQIQIHSYAFEKGDIDWLMSTFRNATPTALEIDSGRIQSWTKIQDYYLNLIQQNPGYLLETSDLNIIKKTSNNIEVTGSQIIKSKSGEVSKSYKFSFSFIKFRGHWLISNGRLTTNKS